jgi:hypothetical protein
MTLPNGRLQRWPPFAKEVFIGFLDWICGSSGPLEAITAP